MKARTLRNIGLTVLLIVSACAGGVWKYRKWLADKAFEEKRWEKRRAQAHETVVGSRLFSRDLLDQLASDYLEAPVKTENCDWSYYPTWHGARKNPNWFSLTSGSDGANVTCDTSARHDDGDEDQLVFEWDVSDDRGIVGFKWRYFPIQLDSE